jgi:hypothetical protein
MFFFFSGGHQFIEKKGDYFFRHLLGQPARADGRDPAKITGRFRANFRLAMCTSQLKINLLSWCTDFFSQGGAPRQRSENPHRMIPIPPKWGAAAWGTPISPKVPMCAGF